MSQSAKFSKVTRPSSIAALLLEVENDERTPSQRFSVIDFKFSVSDVKPPPPIVEPQRISLIATQKKNQSQKIRSFDVIKSVYVYMLLPIHLTNLMHWVHNNDSYVSSFLPYEATDHGQEFIMVFVNILFYFFIAMITCTDLLI